MFLGKKSVMAVAVILFLLNSCGGGEMKNLLSDVESYISERPDSALTVLQSIDRSTFKSESEAAYFSLLYSMALDKNYIDVASDSIICVAARYYRRHGSADRKLKARYYHGLVADYAGDRDLAMERYVDAERFASRAKDRVAVGRLYMAKKLIHVHIYDFESAVIDATSAANAYLEAKDTVRYLRAIIDRASQSFLAHDYISSTNDLGFVREFFWGKLTLDMKSKYYAHLLDLYSKTCPEKIPHCRQEYLNEFINNPADVDWMVVSRTSYCCGDYNESLSGIVNYSILNSEHINEPAFNWLMYKNMDYMDNPDSALNCLKRYVKQVEKLDFDIYESDAKFIEERMASERKSLVHKYTTLILVLLLLLLVESIVLIAIQVRRILARKQAERMQMIAEKESLVAERDSLESQVREAKSDIRKLLAIKNKGALDKGLIQLLDQRLEILNGFVVAKMAAPFNSVSMGWKSLSDYMADRDGFIKSTCASLSVGHPHFISFLQSNGLSDREMACCCFYCMGLSSSEIASYFCVSDKSFYNFCSEIRKKLKLGKNEGKLESFILSKYKELDS